MAKGQIMGLNKGHIVTKIHQKKIKPRVSHKKGKLGERVRFIREVIREVTGLSPYEKRIVELLKVGGVKE